MREIILKSFVVFFGFCSVFYGQSKKTSFNSEENDKLNVVLNGKVKTLKVKSENLINKSYADSIVYFFSKKGDAETIKYYGLGLDVFNKRLRVEEVNYTFKKARLISKLNKMDFGIDGDIYQYDRNSNLIHLKNYMSNILVKEYYYKYDSKNRKIEQTSYSYGGFSNYNEKTQENKSNFLYETEEYQYNDNDKIVLKKVSNFRNNKTIKISNYQYDENGNLIKEGYCVVYGSGDCDPNPLFGYEYNFNNQLIKKYQLTSFSPHNTDEYFIYDNKGNKVESKGMYVYTDKLPFWGYHFIYEYDEFGNKTKDEEIIGKYRMLGRERYKTQITQYDKFHNIISEQYVTEEGSTIKVIIKKYIYDKNGNWISMQKVEGKDRNNLISTEICKREIIYYR
ncbi:hypothetical protein [Flavobacterium limi]|nr:hypothetical protein [Flavobacterium limi]